MLLIIIDDIFILFIIYIYIFQDGKDFEREYPNLIENKKLYLTNKEKNFQRI